MLKLYPYQEETISLLRQGFKNHKRQLMVIPTGGGKTVCFSTIVCSAVQKGTKMLVLTDRIELFNQTVESISSFNIPICKISGDHKHISKDALMYVGMVETVKRRSSSLKSISFDLIICDEAHIASFNRIFDTWPDAMVIGATATPLGKHIYKYYTNLVSCIDTPELVEQGFLSPCKAFQMQDDFSDLKTDNSGEFTDKSLTAHFDKPKLYAGVIEKWLEKTPNTKTIVFNCNIQHTLEMTKAFNVAGIKSYAITSHTDPSEREWILNEYNNNTFPVLNNCGILTKGYNEPSIQTIILNRATTSLALYLQMIGRGSRTYKNKSHFTVLDFGANHDRHGLWNEPREWSIEPPKKKKKPSGVAPVRECKGCGAILPAMQKTCEYCGHTISDQERKLLEGQLIEVTPKISPNLLGKNFSAIDLTDLLEIEKTKQYKSTYIWRIIRSRGEDAIRTWAEHKKYKFGWIKNQIETMEAEQLDGGTKFTDLKIREKQVIN